MPNTDCILLNFCNLYIRHLDVCQYTILWTVAVPITCYKRIMNSTHMVYHDEGYHTIYVHLCTYM